MKKHIRFCLCMLALLLILGQPLAARAASGLDLSKPCSLTLHYTKDGNAFSNLEIHIYRVAAYENSGKYTATEVFAKYPVKIHGIRSQKEWQESTQAMVAYIERDDLSPTVTGKTDTEGTVTFEGLSAGLYLVMGVDVQTPNSRFRFQPFFVFLPTPDDHGVYNYDVEARPKPGVVTPIRQYKVVKLWKDDGNRIHRPDSISVEILKDGILQETAELNSENNWSYSWETTQVDSQWSVVEADVPNGYTVAISAKEGVFTIVNTYSKPPEKEVPNRKENIPHTGDSMRLWPCIMTMCISGGALVILGGNRKRKSK